MAFNFSVLKVRTLSAVVFGILVMGGLFWNSWSFFTLFLIIHLGCLYEYQKLMALIAPSYKNISMVHQWGLLVLGSLLLMAIGPVDMMLGGINLHVIGTRVLPFVLVIMILADLIAKQFKFQNWALSFLGLVYIPMSLSLFFQLKRVMSGTILGDFGYAIPLVLILAIWVNDSLAYIVGSIIGKKPLSTISPNKTWEGTIAGAVLAVLIVTKVLGLYIPIQEKFIFIISLTAVIAGTIGDLIESKLKRLAGVKDSGSMMPGHGGFLDRFDSILFATPFVWLILQFLF
ncbi:MAG: phosphatidate cytidylyltransferase [Bacteroidetes bacterium]|nr:phosphatidate cytidylyltransferase [Bacteroidota bacterium]